MRLYWLAAVLAVIFVPSQKVAAEDALAEIDNIIAAIEREFLGVEPAPVLQPVRQNACSYERDELFSVFDAQSASFAQTERILQDVAGRSNALGRELSLPCPRRFVESNEAEIARLEAIDIPGQLAEVRLLNDCAGPAHDQTVERQEADMLPAQRVALQQRADQFLALESTSTNMMRQYGFFEQQRLELLRGLKGNLALCD